MLKAVYYLYKMSHNTKWVNVYNIIPYSVQVSTRHDVILNENIK